tara:strand:- start:11078 stop:11854 length:777 start_codon:yes stop_codon:yes gene_type:complete
MNIQPHEVEWDRDKISRYWDVFGNINPVTPWFSMKSRYWLLKKIKKILDTRKGNEIKILDMGSGSGEFINFIAERTECKAFGIDLSDERIANASKKYPDVNFSVGSISETDFEESTFDLVISTQTIEHLLDDDLEKAFSEINRILKPGGKALITTRFEEDLAIKKKVCPDCLAIFKHSQHLQTFSINSLKEYLRDANLDVNEIAKSRCRTDFYGVFPKSHILFNKMPAINDLLFYFFGDYLDKRLGIYLYSIAEKRSV